MQQQSLNRWLGQDQAFLAKRLAASFRRLAKMHEVLAPYLVGEAQAYGRDPFDPALNSGGCQDVTALCRALSFRMHQPGNSH
ncbi:MULTISPECIES: hypothetical protein [unclassified Pseudomonas]|uniref:hypothetical protein n=1 Tax=unclassified Pseudomonas TaxID=196821 RepID=UPI001F3EE36D|nr:MULTISPECIES: hypothetical protein [unclassified Pseudomonas]